MNNNNTKITELIFLANKLGGKVKNVKSSTFQEIFNKSKYNDINLSLAPFARYDEELGIDWNNKIVYFCDSKKPIHWGGILHEMGHIFCSTNPAPLSEEFNFLGWEYFIARKLDGVLDWFEYNRDYIITNDSKCFDDYLTRDFEPKADIKNHTTRKDLYSILNERIQVARKTKLIINNQPVSIRR